MFPEALGTQTTLGRSGVMLPPKVFEDLRTAMDILVLFQQFSRSNFV